MKTSTNISRFLTISALVLAVPMTALAYGSDQGGRGAHGRSGMEMHQRHGMPNLRGIDLSAAQVAQLTSLRDEQKKSMTEKGQVLRDQRDALHKLVMSDAYTPAAASEIISKISVAQAEMTKLHAEQSNKLYKLLTPEQRTKLQQNELTMGRGRGA